MTFQTGSCITEFNNIQWPFSRSMTPPLLTVHKPSNIARLPHPIVLIHPLSVPASRIDESTFRQRSTHTNCNIRRKWHRFNASDWMKRLWDSLYLVSSLPLLLSYANLLRCSGANSTAKTWKCNRDSLDLPRVLLSYQVVNRAAAVPRENTEWGVWNGPRGWKAAVQGLYERWPKEASGTRGKIWLKQTIWVIGGGSVGWLRGGSDHGSRPLSWLSLSLSLWLSLCVCLSLSLSPRGPRWDSPLLIKFSGGGSCCCWVITSDEIRGRGVAGVNLSICQWQGMGGNYPACMVINWDWRQIKQ